jgi:hypothetical protein
MAKNKGMSINEALIWLKLGWRVRRMSWEKNKSVIAGKWGDSGVNVLIDEVYSEKYEPNVRDSKAKDWELAPISDREKNNVGLLL